MTLAFFLPQQLIIALHLMVPTATDPLPLYCCSAGSFPILYLKVWFLLQTTALCARLYYISCYFRPFFLSITAISNSDTALVSACMYSQVSDNRRFLYGLFISPLQWLNDVMEKYRPRNKTYSGLTQNTLSGYVPITFPSAIFLLRCDNLVCFLLLLVKMI